MSLTLLETIPAFTEAIRVQLREYWITSVEEFVSTALAGNAQMGSGLRAFAAVLDLPEASVAALVEAGQAALPAGTSFPAEAELVVGTGAIFEGMGPAPEIAFDLPLDLPSACNLAVGLRGPRNQSSRNTCIAFALAALLEQITGTPDLLSPQFIYWACKERDGISGDIGTRPDIGMQVIQELGACRETIWAYDPVRNDHNPGHGPPPAGAVAEAHDRRAAGFVQLPPTDIRRIKATIAASTAVLIGMITSEHWKNTWQSRVLGRVRKPLPGEALGEGHALLAVGYHDDQEGEKTPGGGYFIVRNSWGVGWGRENVSGAGYCHIPYQLVAKQNLAAFTITGMAAIEDAKAHAPAVETTTVVPTSESMALNQVAQLREAQRLATSAQEQLTRLTEILAQLSLSLDDGTVASPPTRTKWVQRKRGIAGPLILLRSATEKPLELLTPNGILATTGEPLLTIDTDTASALARASVPGKKEDTPGYLLHRARVASGETHLGMVFGNENSIHDAGWALVVSADDDATLLKVLSPLIVKRCADQGLAPPMLAFRIGETCGEWLARTVPEPGSPLKRGIPVLVHRPGEDAASFLARHGVSQGPVDPRRGVPFYLLLAGRPGAANPDDAAVLPFLLQYELDIFWGVGRLCFTDPTTGQHDYAAYAAYAEQVVACEQAMTPPYAKHIAYFGTRHAFDASTKRSADELVLPLTEGAPGQPTLAAKFGFTQQHFLAEQATRESLHRILRGQAEGGRPTLLFTATHGIGFPADDPQLVAGQGALVCQDWTGFGSITRDHWYAGADLPMDARVNGLIVVCFACYSIGCPLEDQFVFKHGEQRPVIAPYALVSQLPQRLLAQGALAVLGHVDRAWTTSFSAPGVPAQTQRFESVLGRLMKGDRLGLATDQLNMVQGAVAVQLAQKLEDIRFRYQMTSAELSTLWVAHNDARNYAVLGDPAVRLPFYR